MYNKTRIFNFALNALTLTKRVQDADSDESTEAMNLRDVWDVAVESFLQEVNISELNEIVRLELVAENPNSLWQYAYKYPNKTALVRRIISCFKVDSNETRVEFIKGIHENEAVIFTNKKEAEAEVAKESNLFIALSANSALALGHKLAWLAQGLIATSQDPDKLERVILTKYDRLKSLCQVNDANESHLYDEGINKMNSQTRTRLS